MGSRGRILDTNGVPLAYDKTSYNINFYRDPYQTGEKWRAIYTNIIMETIEILEKNGNKVIDELSIQKDENGELTYYWGGITDEDAIKRRKELWCGNMTISEDATAEEAFNTLRQRYKASPSLSAWRWPVRSQRRIIVSTPFLATARSPRVRSGRL